MYVYLAFTCLDRYNLKECDIDIHLFDKKIVKSCKYMYVLMFSLMANTFQNSF